MRFTLIAAAFFALARPALAAERWLSLEAPRFTVISDLSEADTREWAEEFEQYVGALRRVIPSDETQLPRLTLVLFLHENDFARFRPVGANGRPSPVAGFFARRNDWSIAGLAAKRDDADTRRVIFHEGAHWYMSALEAPRAPWLEEGLAEVFSSFTTDRWQTHLGAPVSRLVDALRKEKWYPLEQLLGIRAGDAVFDEEQRRGLFYAESWLLTHYLVFGERAGSGDRQIATLLRDGLHADLAQLEPDLHEYLQRGRFELRHQPPAPSELRNQRFATASPFAVQVAFAQLALGGRHTEEAERLAQAAIGLQRSSALGYELRGLALEEKGEPDAAAAAYAAAASRGSTNDRIYYEVGMHQLYGGGPRPRLAAATANEANGRAAADNFQRGIALKPHNAGNYVGLAAAMALVGAPAAADRAALARGHSLFPDDGQITLGLAIAAHKQGDRPEASALVASIADDPGKFSAFTSDYARRLTLNWRFEESAGEIVRLAEAGDIDGATRVLEQNRDAPYSAPQRKFLDDFRQDLVIRSHVRVAQSAVADSHWAEARRALAEVMEMEVPLTMKLDALILLNHLDRANK